jgi:hypothetical protein
MLVPNVSAIVRQDQRRHQDQQFSADSTSCRSPRRAGNIAEPTQKALLTRAARIHEKDLVPDDQIG